MSVRGSKSFVPSLFLREYEESVPPLFVGETLHGLVRRIMFRMGLLLDKIVSDLRPQNSLGLDGSPSLYGLWSMDIGRTG